MKFIQSAAILCFAFFSISTVQAQPVDDIIAHHINAIGGQDVLLQVKSIYSEGTASAMGNDLPTKTTVLSGIGSKTETEFNGMSIIQCITANAGWMINPMQGQTDPVVLPADAVAKGRSSLNIGGELFNYKDKGYTASLEGREDIAGVSAYKIKLSKADIELVYFIDPATYYITRSDTKASVNGQDFTTTANFSGYRKTDIGFVVPYTIGTTNMGYDISINYNKILINQEVDPKIFDMLK